MDYCYACRRHLNGAYSCPGCGTPADRLTLPSAAEGAQPPPLPGEEAYDPAPADGGRAARRAEDRRRASRRAKRGRQRVAVYGIGAVAVAGALAMFSVAALSGGSDGGSDPTAPVGHSGITSGDATPDDPSTAVDSPTSHSPAASSASPDSPSPEPSTTKPTASPTTAAPTTHAPSTTRPPTTTAPPPTATPSPTHTTCKPVLWWCSKK